MSAAALIPQPAVPYSTVIAEMALSLFTGAQMSPEAAKLMEIMQDDWGTKVSLLERAYSVVEMTSYGDLLRGLVKGEAKLLSDDSIASCASNIDGFEKWMKCVLAAMKFRLDHMELLQKRSEKQTAQANSQALQRHVHVHLSGAASADALPEVFVNSQREREVAALVFEMFRQGVREVTGTSKIPPPIPRLPRVFTPTDDLKSAPPLPLTDEEIDALEGK